MPRGAIKQSYAWAYDAILVYLADGAKFTEDIRTYMVCEKAWLYLRLNEMVRLDLIQGSKMVPNRQGTLEKKWRVRKDKSPSGPATRR